MLVILKKRAFFIFYYSIIEIINLNFCLFIYITPVTSGQGQTQVYMRRRRSFDLAECVQEFYAQVHFEQKGGGGMVPK